MRECVKCKEVKEESQFSKDRGSKDGLCIYCKRCVANQPACRKRWGNEMFNYLRITAKEY